MTQYNTNEIEYKTSTLWDYILKEHVTVTRGLCPECINHDQGFPDKFHDCKNTFKNTNGKIVGQCCCWSKEHGVRKR